MTFSVFDWIVQPYLHSHGSSYGLFMNLKDSFLESFPTIAFIMTAALPGCFAATIYSITINFIYRFFALQREGGLRFFSKNRLVFWMLIPILVACLFITNNWFFFPLNSEVNEYMRTNLKEKFDLDVDRTIYIVCLYWRTDGNGKKYLSFRDLTGSFVFNTVVSLPLCIILYFGTKSYFIVKELVSKGESEYSRRLQTQLYKALVAQILIPIVFLFIPMASLIFCPLFGINVEWASLLVTFLYSFYPAVDPIPNLILVDEYRNAFCNFFRRALSQNEVVSVVSIDHNVDNI